MSPPFFNKIILNYFVGSYVNFATLNWELVIIKRLNLTVNFEVRVVATL